MPLKDTIYDHEFTKIVTWELAESNDELLHFLGLNKERTERYLSLRPKQAREYLGICACLKILGLNYDIFYNEKGKPYLPSNNQLSITHSYDLVSVAISDFNIGIDIEKERNQKVINIKKKFIRGDEFSWLPSVDEEKYLHVIWGIKEGLYKLNGGNLWNFLHHYRVEPFELVENRAISCWISDEHKSRKYFAYYKMIESYYLIWVLDYE